MSKNGLSAEIEGLSNNIFDKSNGELKNSSKPEKVAKNLPPEIVIIRSRSNDPKKSIIAFNAFNLLNAIMLNWYIAMKKILIRKKTGFGLTENILVEQLEILSKLKKYLINTISNLSKQNN